MSNQTIFIVGAVIFVAVYYQSVGKFEFFATQSHPPETWD